MKFFKLAYIVCQVWHNVFFLNFKFDMWGALWVFTWYITWVSERTIVQYLHQIGEMHEKNELTLRRGWFAWLVSR